MSDAYLRVGFLDSAERISERRYLMRTEFLDDSPTNMSALIAESLAIITALDVCTMDHIEFYNIEVVTYPSGASANAAANNQTVAFSRFLDVLAVRGSLEVPAWDDVVFDQNHDNILSGAYNAAIAAVALLTRNPENGEDWVLLPEYTQSHTRKSGIKLG